MCYFPSKALLVLVGVAAVSQTLAQDASVHLPVAYPSAAPVNYVRTWDVVKPITDATQLTIGNGLQTARITTQYLDGLGRPIQTVVKQGSWPTGASAVDMVSANTYDEFGREARSYLPFAANAQNNTSISDGLFKLNPFQQQQHFYSDAYANGTAYSPIKGQGETYYYGKTEFEASPLNRPERSYAPGNSWVSGSGKGVKTKYWINTVDDAVRIWNVVDGSVGDFGTYSSPGAYPAGELYKNVIVDENDKQVIEFKDKEGKVVLKKVQLTAAADGGSGSGHGGWLSTYYLYDDLGRLRAVIQPRGVEVLDGNWNLSGNTTLLSEQCFRYAYDERSRMVRKQVPGAASVWMVYDKRDRLVMTQDGNMGTGTKKWLVTLYDELNRPVQTGLWTNASTWATHKGDAATANGYEYPFGATSTPASGWEELTKTFYDNYNWRSGEGNPLTATLDNSWNNHYLAASTTVYPYAETPGQSGAVKGMVTGMRVKVLGSSPAQYLYTVTIYDEDGRAVQVQAQNITGGVDIATTQYSFSGQVLLTIMRHQKGSGSSATTQTVVTLMTYDDLGRLVKTEKKLNSENTYKKISELAYDALGQLKTKKLAPDRNSGAGLETLTHDYNIRGWMLGVNRADLAANGASTSKFAFDLGYDKQTNASGRIYNAPAFNGNITGMVWKSAGDGVRRKYDFGYDAANRLLKGDFEQNGSGTTWNNTDVNYNVKMGNGSTATSAYDANGNILRMQQWGLKGLTSIKIDDLTYDYHIGGAGDDYRNKLQRVTDGAYNDPGIKIGDFKDGTGSGDDYSYDVNGNLIADYNKAISSIQYNHLNLPQTVTVTSKGDITYTYDAGGTKLKKVTTDNTVSPAKVTTTLYLFGTYEDDQLQFLPMEEGRIRFAKAEPNACPSPLPDRFIYDYMLKDHLGNVRMVLTEAEETKCYPGARVEDVTWQTEGKVYDIQNTRRVDKGLAGAANIPSFESKVYRTDGATPGEKTGLGTVLKVMAGDEVKIYAESFYQLAAGNANQHYTMALTDFLNVMTGSGAITGAKGAITGSAVQGLGNNQNVLNSFINRTPVTDQAKAYLNWVLFDEQLKVVSVGADPVNGTGNGGYKFHNQFINAPVAVTKNGYLFVFVSNESNLPVFFDNLTLTHTQGPILEETHYYPFGLTMAGISSKSAGGGVENKKKFQEQELASKEFSDGSGLELYEFKWRMHDPQTGRFWQIDPLAEKYVYNSTYAFSENKVTGHRELEGLEAWAVNPVKEGDGTVAMVATVTKLNAPFSVTTNGGAPTGFFPLAQMNRALGGATVSEDRLQVPVNANGDYVTYSQNSDGGVNFTYRVTDMAPTPTMTTNIITQGTPVVLSGLKEANGIPTTTPATTLTTPAITSATAPTVSLSHNDLGFPNTFTVTDNSSRSANPIITGTGIGGQTTPANNFVSGGTFSVRTTTRVGQTYDGYNFTLTVTPTVSTPTVVPTPAAVANQLTIVPGQSRSLKHNISLPYSN